MTWSKPSLPEMWNAIDVWIATAYAGNPPTAVRDRVATLRNMPAEDFFECSAIERDASNPPTKYSLRLGSRMYPHMKMVIERSPDGKEHLFRADTHDRHIRPAPESREYKAFADLMVANQKLAESIETEWGQRGLPTFRNYLARDLARRGVSTDALTPPAGASTP